MTMDGPGQARRSDPLTAQEAAKAVRPGSVRFRLLEAHSLKQDGLTDEEAATQAGISLLSEYATRCSELKRMGLIEDTERSRVGHNGVNRIVRRITPLGLQVARGESRTERPGRPDRYVDLRRSASLAADASRKAAHDAEQRRLRETPRIAPGTLKVAFGDRLCPRCEGSGGSLLEACTRCRGQGKVA